MLRCFRKTRLSERKFFYFLFDDRIFVRQDTAMYKKTGTWSGAGPKVGYKDGPTGGRFFWKHQPRWRAFFLGLPAPPEGVFLDGACLEAGQYF